MICFNQSSMETLAQSRLQGRQLARRNASPPKPLEGKLDAHCFMQEEQKLICLRMRGDRLWARLRFVDLSSASIHREHRSLPLQFTPHRESIRLFQMF